MKFFNRSERIGRIYGLLVFLIGVSFTFESPCLAQALAGPTNVAAAEATLDRSASTDETVSRDWRQERIRLEHQFGEALSDIGNWCREQGIGHQVEPTYRLKLKRDPRRQYIFPPTTQTMPVPQEGLLGEWLAKVNEARCQHAERIFQLAEEAANADDGAIAYRLLHEVIHFNHDHQRARKMLGHVKRKDQWRVASENMVVRVANKDHDLFDLPAGGYIKLISPHFEIESSASEARTRYLAEQLERWYGVWRQIFFEYWSSGSYPKKVFAGKSSLFPRTRRKFRVAFFKNQAEYVSQLGKRVRGAAGSSGYYSDVEKISIFFDGDALVQDTWQHELTHQLFRESSKTRVDAFTKQDFWIDEGVACYFESLRDFGDHVTLGGFDARRMQFARVRRLMENYYVTLDELSSLNRDQFQRRPDMVWIYSQSAGLVDMIMNSNHGEMEQSLVKFLWLVYKRKPKPGTFEDLLGYQYEELDKRYLEYLKVDSATVENFLERPVDQDVLSVSDAGLELAAFESIGRCVNLNWLDLSGNQITRKRLAKLHQCDRLQQIFMTRCQFGDRALMGLAGIENLQEVDLSGSSVSRASLADLANCSSLISLKLIATDVTDDDVRALAKLPSLKAVDLSRTRVSNAAIAQLRQAKPGLAITR